MIDKESCASHLPLSPAILHILLALASEERHGYAIMQEIAQQSEGKYKIGPGTLYDNLQKLMRLGFVVESRRANDNEDSRRRYYKLTELGKGVLSAEVARLEGVLRAAKAYLRPVLGRRQ